jgi:diaminopimelate decarboxylase
MMNYPKLTPILHPWIKDFLAHSEQLAETVGHYHSPINIHNLTPFRENYEEYKSTFNKYGIKHQVYYARKANKCLALVKEAKRLGFGVDTASYRELKQCIDEGLPPRDIAITAAIKNKRLIQLALDNNVPIVLDNLDECELVNRIASERERKINVGVRVGGFEHEGKKLYTRFGFSLDRAFELITQKMQTAGDFSHLEFSGLHFHLNGYSTSQRAEALIQTLALTEKLKAEGIRTEFIDMGGGFLMNYLRDEKEWETFHQELRKAFGGERAEITFANNGLGLQIFDGKVFGEPQVYPYFNKTPRKIFLEEILNYQDLKGKPLHTLLAESNIEIRIEPGRSLLDQVGITVARVAFRKKDMNGDWLVGLEMNRTQLFSSSADFLLDPIVIHRNTTEAPLPTTGYLVGAYCLEQELILKRKLDFERLPDIGDLVCFVNTAGYMMHFYESEAHLFELATNLIVSKKENEYAFTPDDISD